MMSMFAVAMLLARFTGGPLDAPIGITEYAAPARVVCRDLGKLTGVRMECDPFIGDDRVVLVVKSRPAREIMAKLAGTFGWEWQPDGAGYRLVPTSAFRIKAQTGRRDILLAEGRARQQAARDQLADMERGGVDVVKRALTALNEYRRDTSPSRDQHLDAYRQANPYLDLALRAFADLDPDQIVWLYDHRLVAGIDPSPLEIPFSPRTSDLAAKILETQCPPTHAGNVGFADLPEKWSQISAIDVEFDDWNKAAVIVRLANGVPVEAETFALPEASPVKIAVYSPAAREMEGAGSDVKFDPVSTTPPDTVDPLTFIGAGFQGVARVLGSDLISDVYDGYAACITTGTPGPQSHEAADRFHRQGVDPVLSGGWLTIRSAKWPQLRDEQWPTERLRIERANDHNFWTLDERAASFGALTPAQLHSPFSTIDATRYHFWRFWESLPSPLRQVLLTGKKVRLDDLPSSAVEYLFEEGERPEDVKLRGGSFSWGGTGPFTEPEFTDYDLILRRLQSENEPETSGSEMPPLAAANDFAILYPGQTGGHAWVWVQAATIPALLAEDGSTRIYPGELLPGPGGMHNDVGQHLKLVHETAYRFHFQILPDIEVRADTSEVTVVGDVPSDPSRWPQELMDRIRRRQAIEARVQAALTNDGSSAPPP